MEYKGNNWIVLDKSLLTPEEYIVVLRILDRIDGSNLAETLIKAESTNFLGGLSLPQYYGISAEEVENMRRDEERQKRNNERWEDIKQSLGYKEPTEFPVESTLKKEWFTNTIPDEGWYMINGTWVKGPLEEPLSESPEGNPIEHWGWYFGKVDPSRCDELKYNPNEQSKDKEE